MNTRSNTRGAEINTKSISSPQVQ